MDRIKAPDNLETMMAAKKAANKAPTELHEFINKARTELGETAKSGDGSYGFYLGILKKIPLTTCYMFLSESRAANNPIKTFWWKIGQYKKEMKSK